MTAPTLSDYQFWFGSDSVAGQTFGEGTLLHVERVTGIESVAVRSGNRPIPRRDGSTPGFNFVESKIITFDCIADGGSAYGLALESIKPSTLEVGELHFKLPYLDQRFFRARLVSRSEEIGPTSFNDYPFTMAFEAADPRAYGNVQRTKSVQIFNSVSGGTDFEIDYEVDFSIAAGDSGLTIATNLGRCPAFPVVRFYGPTVGTCTGVLLENVTNGDSIDVDATILTDQILTVDMDSRVRGEAGLIVSLDGSSRYGSWQLPRNDFSLAVGDNILKLSIDGTSTDVTAVLSWRDTYV